MGKTKNGGTRETNHNWKGGRLINSNGYVLIRVGVDHHLADVRGYAYEHRLNAEKKLGRRLEQTEEVHHFDENHTNNAEDNLIICKGKAEHLFHHRKPNSKLRLPGEENPIVSCECGCGSTFNKYDTQGRPRLYKPGHNPEKSPTIDSILKALSKNDRPLSISELLEATGNPSRIAIKVAVSKMYKFRLIKRVSHGLYIANNK